MGARPGTSPLGRLLTLTVIGQEKPVVKLTAKAFSFKLERLQNEKKTKFSQASSVKTVLQGLMDENERLHVVVKILLTICSKYMMKQNVSMSL